MKLLHCLNSPHIGGIERLVIELAIEQKRQGIDVSIMLDTRKGQYYEKLAVSGIPIFDSNIKSALDFSFSTYKYLTTHFNQFDIVHIHSYSALRLQAASKSNAYVVYTIHGLSQGIRQENKIKSLIREALKKHHLNQIDYFIANSMYTLGLALQHYTLDNVRKNVVLNGITLSNIETLSAIKDTKEFVIGLVSRFTPRKRIDRLITAFRHFLNNGGAGTLVLIGDGETFKSIKTMVSELGLDEHVEMPGYSTDVGKYYQRFDVCVFPSEQEPFGLVAVEAYNFGKPVLCFSDSGGLQEIVSPLEPQNIVHNEEQLANRLLHLYINRQDIDIGANARKEYAQANFSLGRMERDYFNIYSELLND